MKRSYGIAGNGRASAHLQAYFRHLGIPYILWHRRLGAAPEETLCGCSHIFLLLTDSSIKQFIAAHPFLKNKTLIHFSGSLSVPGTHSIHPFMPLSPRPLTLAEYRAIPFALEPGVSLKRLVPEFSNPVLRVPAGSRRRYHAYCALGANLPVLFWREALAGLSRYGVKPAQARNYFRASLENFAADPGAALTGPIARGDRDTVEADIKALGKTHFAKVYSIMAENYEHK